MHDSLFDDFKVHALNNGIDIRTYAESIEGLTERHPKFERQNSLDYLKFILERLGLTEHYRNAFQRRKDQTQELPNDFSDMGSVVDHFLAARDALNANVHIKLNPVHDAKSCSS